MNDILENIVDVASIVFWFVIILIPLVAIHEFGHLLMARINKVKVVEYGIGLPPRAWFKKWKGIIWSLNWLPLGGFAKIYGDHDAIDSARADYESSPKEARENYKAERLYEIIKGKELQFFLEENSLDYDKEWADFEEYMKKEGLKSDIIKKTYEKKFNQLQTLIDWELDAKMDSKEALFNKKYWQKVLIMLGGVLFNFITAIFLFMLLLNFSSVEKTYLADDASDVRNQDNIELVDQEKASKAIVLNDVEEDSPAGELGLELADEIITYGGKDMIEFATIDEFSDFVQKQEDRKVAIRYYDQSQDKIVETTIAAKKDSDDDKYRLGVLYGYQLEYKADGFGASFGLAYKETTDVFKATFSYLGELGKAIVPGGDDGGDAVKNLKGPIAVGGVGSDIFDRGGASAIIQLMAIISVNLAVLNLLPIPALDGGRILILTINKIIGKRSKKVEAIVISVTMFLLIGLMVMVAFNDIKWLNDIN